MPTGFEAVGLALAIFPVLVEGLKFYAEEKGVIKDLFHYQHVLKRIVRDLAREQTSFRNSCQRFLEDIAVKSGLGEHEVSEMMLDPKDPRWKEESWFQEDALSQESVQRYLETVEDMTEELKKIQQWVGIDGDSQPEVLDKRTRRRQWRKLILVIKQDEIAEHMERAGRLNTFLARLTEQNQPTATARRGTRKGTKHYKRIRSHAMDLYEILQSKLPTPPICNCALQHEVNVRLEFRSAQKSANGVSFHIIFSFESGGSTAAHSPPWGWREMEVEPFDAQESVDNAVAKMKNNEHPTPPAEPQPKTSFFKKKFEQPTPPAEPQPKTGLFELISKEAKKPRKRVAFLNPSPTHVSPDPTGQEISNLCSAIAAPAQSKEWLGYIANGQGRQHRIRAIDQKRALSKALKNNRTVPLTEVLGHREFRREHRSRLGLKLASSVMQLHTTQWLTDHWSKEDIFFIRSSDGTVNFGNPLIRRSFGPVSKVCATRDSSKPRISSSIPCLFSLGIVLIELWHGQPFEDLKNDSERAMACQAQELSDRMTADRLVDSIECGPNYSKAVVRCIFGLDAAYTSLVEDKFRDEVEEKIMFPLEENLKFYCDKTSVEECL
ncbi:hypothetical protein FQN54_003743 [Arachnomyces sp. PD_36]|nr:hypothetical protein FQN54_003743 [Arachnomyces sp. PD_36]